MCVHAQIKKIPSRSGWGGGPDISVFHRGSHGPPSRSNWVQLGFNCLSMGSVPVFVRKTIATCGFLGGSHPLPPPLWIHA